MADDDQKDDGPIEDSPANENLSPNEQQALSGSNQEPVNPIPETPAPSDDNSDVEEPDNTESAPADAGLGQSPPTNQPPSAAPNPSQTIDQITNPTAQEMDQHSLQWAQDLANRHIAPKTYKQLFADQDTGGKIGLAFSILLGGIGSGLTHQTNAALDIMDKTIQRDFEAQKLSKENANNFLRTENDHQMQLAQQKLMAAQASQIPITSDEIRARTGDIKADAYLKAQNASINNMKISMMQELSNTVDKLPPQQQQQARDVLNNVIVPRWTDEIQKANAQTAAQLQTRNAVRNQPGGQGQTAQPNNQEAQYADKQQKLRLLGMDDIANNNDARHLPGVGNSSIPLSGEDRDRITKGMSFQNQLQGFINWSRSHSGDLNPADQNEGAALAAQLQAAYRDATNGGVYKEGEQHFIGKIITDDPTKFFNEIRSVPQLKAVQHESGAQLNQLVKSKGFDKTPEIQPTWAPPKSSAPATNSTPPDGTKGTANGIAFTWKNGKRVKD